MANTNIRNIPSNLPEVEFVDTDAEALVQKLITGYEEIVGKTLYPADPIRVFILWLASVIIQERILTNESAKQNLPRYAVGEKLDSLSEFFKNTYRLSETAATTTLKFEITTTLEKDYIITDQVEVTIDGVINFVTQDYIVFKAGETTAEVPAICTILGVIGNDYIAGQINKLVSDEFLYFKSVVNITTSAGGSDKESDAALYNRMRESEESYTTAGAKNSYIYHTKSVSSLISDVSADSPEPGVADIRVMLQNGKLPDIELLEKVRNYLSADDVRPFTDKVVVSAPDVVEFDIDIMYYISSDKKSSAKDIQTALENGIENYLLWQTQKMGRDINPSYFNAVLMTSGIKRVDIISPKFTKVPKGSVAVIKNRNIVFGGVEDE